MLEWTEKLTVIVISAAVPTIVKIDKTYIKLIS